MSGKLASWLSLVRNTSQPNSGSQADRAQVRSVEKTEKLRQPLAFTHAKDGDQTLGERQFADCEPMSALFECGQMTYRSLLVGGDAFDRVDNDHGIQIVQHSLPSRRGLAARGIQFPIPFGILGHVRFFFGTNVISGPARKTTGALFRCNLPEHARKSARWPNRCGNADRHLHRAGRELRLMCQLKLAVRVEGGLDRFFDEIHGTFSFDLS
jgi:hypothetical protein